MWIPACTCLHVPVKEMYADFMQKPSDSKQPRRHRTFSWPVVCMCEALRQLLFAHEQAESVTWVRLVTFIVVSLGSFERFVGGSGVTSYGAL